LLSVRESVARDTYMDLKWIQRRNILRHLILGEKMINGLTVTENDGNAVFDDGYRFRNIFVNWWRFHVRTRLLLEDLRRLLCGIMIM